MTTKQAAELYARIGRTPPPEITAPSAEYIRNTRRKLVDGIPFRSTLEADAYQILKSWRDAGEITHLELQPKFLLQPGFRRRGPVDGEWVRAITYKADFGYQRNGVRHVIEAKGFRTEAYRLRRKLFLGKHSTVVFEEWTRETMRGL